MCARDLNHARVGYLLARAKEAYREGGMSHVLAARAKPAYRKIDFVYLFGTEAYHRLVNRGRSFQFNGERYPYLCRSYNRTWDNERAVEVPIVWKLVKTDTGRILEIGNVLSHYFPCRHEVLDKYERGRRVISCDVVDYKPSTRYDLIVSISTLEHVGFDPPEDRNSNKFIQAVDNLQTNCLASSGKIVLTLPLGYNSQLDHLISRGKPPFSRVFYMKRISSDNDWVQTEAHDVVGAKYGSPFPCANAFVVALITQERPLALETSSHHQRPIKRPIRYSNRRVHSNDPDS
jgi:hypothetical protein